MSRSSPSQPSHPVRSFIRGVGNIGEFVREAAVALVEVAIGRGAKPFGTQRRAPKAPHDGLGPIEKIVPFPIDD